MTPTTNYGEPWYIGEMFGSIIANDGETIIESHDVDDRLAPRIVTTINACAGLESPAEAIAAAREALKAITKRAKVRQGLQSGSLGHMQYTITGDDLDACEAALKLLTQTPH